MTTRKQTKGLVYLWRCSLNRIRSYSHDRQIWCISERIHQEWPYFCKDERAWNPYKQSSGLSGPQLLQFYQVTNVLLSDFPCVLTQNHIISLLRIMQPAASRESFAQAIENGRTNGNGDNCGEFDAVMCSKSSSQSKRSRKASAVSFQPQLYFNV